MLADIPGRIEFLDELPLIEKYQCREWRKTYTHPVTQGDEREGQFD